MTEVPKYCIFFLSRYPELIIFPAVVGSLTTGTQATQTITNIFTGSILHTKVEFYTMLLLLVSLFNLKLVDL